MSNPLHFKLLGSVLQKADLISAEQIEIALREQTQSEHKRLGEIMASQGWIKQETANFFAEQWLTLLKDRPQQPLGHYLKKASLLNEDQIDAILSDQKQTGLRFGTLVALKGWLKQTTINFFVESLSLAHQANFGQPLSIENFDNSNQREDLKRIHKGIIDNKDCDSIQLLELYRQILQQVEIPANNSREQAQLLNLGLIVEQNDHLRVANRLYERVFNLNWVESKLVELQPCERMRIELFQLEKTASSPYSVLEAILSWTDGQFFLTQKFCQLIRKSEVFIPAGSEQRLVEQLVQNYLQENWQTRLETKPISSIRDGLLRNENSEVVALLKLYRQVLQQVEIPINKSREQAQLLELGLVVRQHNHLRVANRFYEQVFNLNWVEGELICCYPFNQFANELLELQKNADSPYSVLEAILSWTDGQFFLTQKFCQLIRKSEVFIPAGSEQRLVEQLVQNYLLKSWQTRLETKPIRSIRDGLLRNERGEAVALLKLYRQVLLQVEIPANNSREQAQLIELGLVVKQHNYLRVANRFYEQVFNLNWVEGELAKTLPFSISETKKDRNRSRTSMVAGGRSPKKTKISQINSRIFLLLLFIPGLFWFSFNLLFKERVAQNFQQGNELLNQGEYGQALAKYDRVLKSDSSSYTAWTNRGYALAGLGEYDKMLQSCSTASEIEPKATYAWNCQGEALHNLNRDEEALSVFDRAITIAPGDYILWINKSESLLALKRFDEALAAIERAIAELSALERVDSKEQVNREFSVALNSKGRILGEKGRFEEALVAYERSLEYAPDYFSAQRGTGIALKGLERYDEADTHFNKMLENSQLSDSQRAEVWFYKGLTLCERDWAQAGVTAFAEALKLKPDYKAAQAAAIVCQR